MDDMLFENHKRYCARISLFKQFGYDMDAERTRLIEKVQPLRGRILELGTGKGYFTVALAQKGYCFTTVDLSEEEQRFARMNICYLGLQDRVAFVVADAGALSFPDASFDAALTVNMMHHLDRPLDVVDELFRVTAPGGTIVISDFNRRGFSIVEEIHRSEGRIHPPGLCTLNEVAAYARGRGVSVDRVELECQDILILKARDPLKQG